MWGRKNLGREERMTVSSEEVLAGAPIVLDESACHGLNTFVVTTRKEFHLGVFARLRSKSLALLDLLNPE